MTQAQAVFIACADAPGVYALQVNGAPAGYGWTGYVLSANDDPPVGQPISLADAFQTYAGSYVFAPSVPLAGLAALPTNVAAFLAPIGFGARGVLWLPDPTLANPVPVQAASRFSIVFGATLLNPTNYTKSNFSVWLGPDNTFTFSVGLGTQVGWDTDHQALTFLGGPSGVVFQDTPSAGLAVVRNTDGLLADAILPLTGDRAGAFTLTTQMTPETTFGQLVPGFGFWAFNGQRDAPFAFPAFDRSGLNPAEVLNFATAIDPLDPLNLNLPATGPMSLDSGALRTGLTVVGPAPCWPTQFRSLEGRTITLTALGGQGAREGGGPFDGPPARAGGFAFMSRQPVIGTPTPGTGSFLLTPCGDFALGVDGVSAGVSGQTLLCGLFGSERFSFTTWDAQDPSSGCLMRFQTAKPAYAPIFPFPNATLMDPAAGSVAADRLTNTYRTAWANVIGPDPLYQAEPDGGAYYGGAPTAGAPLLGPTPPGTAVPQMTGFFSPITPYGAFAPDPGWTDPGVTVSAYESQILSATRKAAFGGAGSPARRAREARHLARLGRAAGPETSAWTTTRQGLLAQVASTAAATDFLQVTLSQYQPRAPTPGGDPPPPAPFGFSCPTAVVQEALQTSQLFVAAVNAAPLGTPNSTSTSALFQNVVDIADWRFLVDVGVGVQATDYSNVLILKYCDGALIDWVKNPNKWVDAADFSLLAGFSDPSIGYTGLSGWLATYLEDAIAKAKGDAKTPPNPLYANIAQIAQQTDWKGFLALRASLPPDAALPPQIEGLAAGIDPQRFYAHHFGATLSRVKPNPNTTSEQTLIIDGVSSLFGLIDYQDPLYSAAIAAGADPDAPLLIDGGDPYNFRVLNLQALFVNAKLASFQSRIQITLNQMFDADVKTTLRVDAAQRSRRVQQPGAGVVLDGSAVSQNGTTVYIFQQSKPTLFTFNTPVLHGVSIARAQFNTLGAVDGVVSSRFLFWGAFDFTALSGSDGGGAYDLLSFGSDGGQALGQGLAFANLQLTMQSPQANPTLTTFAFDPSNLAFDLGGSLTRSGGLFEDLALQLQGFIAAPQDKTPADYGFLTVQPEGLKVTDLSGPWCGVVYKINMGGPGALVAAAGFSSQLLVAWSPVAGGDPAVFVGLSLPGAAPGASVFSLQGVFKVTTGPIILQRAPAGLGQTEPSFSLKLSDIGVTILGIKKIPDATIQFFLFGDPSGQGSLGWYASYNDANNAGAKSALAGPGRPA